MELLDAGALAEHAARTDTNALFDAFPMWAKCVRGIAELCVLTLDESISSVLAHHQDDVRGALLEYAAEHVATFSQQSRAAAALDDILAHAAGAYRTHPLRRARVEIQRALARALAGDNVAPVAVPSAGEDAGLAHMRQVYVCRAVLVGVIGRTADAKAAVDAISRIGTRALGPARPARTRRALETPKTEVHAPLGALGELALAAGYALYAAGGDALGLFLALACGTHEFCDAARAAAAHICADADMSDTALSLAGELRDTIALLACARASGDEAHYNAAYTAPRPPRGALRLEEQAVAALTYARLRPASAPAATVHALRARLQAAALTSRSSRDAPLAAASIHWRVTRGVYESYMAVSRAYAAAGSARDAVAFAREAVAYARTCLLYTSDAADE